MIFNIGDTSHGDYKMPAMIGGSGGVIITMTFESPVKTMVILVVEATDENAIHIPEGATRGDFKVGNVLPGMSHATIFGVMIGGNGTLSHNLAPRSEGDHKSGDKASAMSMVGAVKG